MGRNKRIRVFGKALKLRITSGYLKTMKGGKVQALLTESNWSGMREVLRISTPLLSSAPNWKAQLKKGRGIPSGRTTVFAAHSRAWQKLVEALALKSPRCRFRLIPARSMVQLPMPRRCAQCCKSSRFSRRAPASPHRFDEHPPSRRALLATARDQAVCAGRSRQRQQPACIVVTESASAKYPALHTLMLHTTISIRRHISVMHVTRTMCIPLQNRAVVSSTSAQADANTRPLCCLDEFK